MTPQPPLPSRPRLLVVLSALLFSTAAPVAKFVALPAMAVSFCRSTVGLFAILALMLPKYGRSMFRFTGRDFLCGLAYAMTSLSFFLAMKNTTAANATILFQTTPVFLLPLGFLFHGERADAWDVPVIALMGAGIVLCFRGSVVVQGHSGDLFALCGALSFAFMNILMRKSDFTGSIRGLLAGNVFIVIAALPFLRGVSFTPGDTALAGALGVLHMAVPFLLYSRALMVLRALEAAVFKNLETVAAPFWVALVTGEIPGVWTVTGFICVLAALVLRGWKSRRTTKAVEQAPVA